MRNRTSVAETIFLTIDVLTDRRQQESLSISLPIDCNNTPLLGVWVAWSQLCLVLVLLSCLQ